MLHAIVAALERAIRVARRTAPKPGGSKRTQKRIIRANLAVAAAKLSGRRRYLFSLRQLFYELRPLLIQALGREPKYGTFSRIVGAFEDECGDIEHLYRDDRGILYHPHTKETIPLGTRSVAAYQRPRLGFRSLLFCEKEGLFPMLKHARWPEQFDCALCSSKGFATRAARALIRLLKESGEQIVVFVIHDADGPGTVIFETLQKALEPYGIEVINLGLDPAEGRKMRLTVEPVERKKKRVPVAGYVSDADREWLQKHRIELNAMTTPRFIGWLTGKIVAYFQSKGWSPKVIPPFRALQEQVRQEARAALERLITDEVLRAADVPGQVEAAFAKFRRPLAAAAKALGQALPGRLEGTPASHWTDVVRADVADVVFSTNGEKPANNADSEAGFQS
jgi:hypothetical protein